MALSSCCLQICCKAMDGAAESKQDLSRGGQIHAAGFGQALFEQLQPKLQHKPSSAWPGSGPSIVRNLIVTQAVQVGKQVPCQDQETFWMPINSLRGPLQESPMQHHHALKRKISQPQGVSGMQIGRPCGCQPDVCKPKPAEIPGTPAHHGKRSRSEGNAIGVSSSDGLRCNTRCRLFSSVRTSSAMNMIWTGPARCSASHVQSMTS